MPHDWQSVVLRCSAGEATKDVPLVWYGEYLWRASVPFEQAGRLSFAVVASDAAGNMASSPPVAFAVK
jgi:hypothetical protein